MMKTMIKRAGLWLAGMLTGVLLAAMPGSALGQQYTISSVGSVTNAVPASTTDSTGSDAVGLTRYDSAALLLSFQGSGPDTGNVTFLFKFSTDGTNYDSAAVLQVVAAANGTNAVVVNTNVTMNSMGYLKLKSIQNAATNSVTNVFIRYATKPRRTG